MPREARPSLGVIMLDTKFKRVLGDIGNPDSFDFPVLYHKVPKAEVHRIISSGSIDDLLPAFIEAAKTLEYRGAQAITTSCGFLSLLQTQLAKAVKVPLVTSSLSLVPDIYRAQGAKPLVIVTASRENLAWDHLHAVGISPNWDIHIIGMETCPAFRKSILSDADPEAITLDPQALQDELVTLCQSSLIEHPDTAGFLFECTNLQPYAAAVQQTFQRPVWGINDVIARLNPSFRMDKTS